jgi:hypothetical protein
MVAEVENHDGAAACPVIMGPLKLYSNYNMTTLWRPACQGHKKPPKMIQDGYRA